ncbi:MAG TPA: ribosome-associated protein, partial [Alteromonas australica]|nr:ribosome-associated protein [Alteromonas australica]
MSDRNPNSQQDPQFNDELEDENFISKTELKRQAKEHQKLGESIVNLTPAHLDTVPLDEELADAVNVARNVSRKKEGF